MGSVAIILLVLFGAIVLVGVVVAIVAFRKAPDGFEDRDGFHPKNKPKK